MHGIMSRIGMAGVLALAAACGGTEAGNLGEKESPPAALSAAHERDDDGHRDGCKEPADFDTGSHRVDSELNITRRAVCRYRRLEAALADGYVNTGLACVPGQGYHYIKSSLVGTTDIRHPPVLMYTADGELNSPEWVAPLDQLPVPHIFGQTLHADDDVGLNILHVWVWKLNRNGVFNDINPRVTCP